MSRSPKTSNSTPRLERSGVLRLLTVVGSLVVTATLFFVGAGTLDLFRGWLYYGGLLAYLLVALTLLLAFFPGTIELVNERGKLGKEGVKAWDKAFAVAYLLLSLAMPLVAGLDVGRFHWSAVPSSFAVPALVATVVSYALAHWAMIANKFAEAQVRIQHERDHVVVSSGPYGFVRHPFYVSSIAGVLLYPLAIGSLWAYAPVICFVGLFLWRTAREDATLLAELPGYAEYAKRVPYRLLPGVW